MFQNYYQTHAKTFFDGTVNVDMSSLYLAFTRRLPAHAKVLDAGCGSGRDAFAFTQMGYQVEAFDASPELVTLAREHTCLPVKLMTFAEVDAKDEYDGIWCCASLLHVPFVQLPGVMQKLAAALKYKGVWYFSFKYGNSERVKDGRSFTDINEERLATLLQNLPDLEIAEQWITQDVRPDRDEMWLNVILIRR
ncbi:class I SAM-dependent methyltransferase [Cedecea neteri]|uniref:class I SAM-dependent methyltransferase n=1 Tax=Cedecea neteri TaxID=158822 RepID=UPI002893541B|nr:class I SAM-dependent methyltransferase [Cedecea neteri]WNJ80113.1 class I SAM-dependent methyltransferase [Cedecea neteri]